MQVSDGMLRTYADRGTYAIDSVHPDNRHVEMSDYLPIDDWDLHLTVTLKPGHLVETEWPIERIAPNAESIYLTIKDGRSNVTVAEAELMPQGVLVARFDDNVIPLR